MLNFFTKGGLQGLPERLFVFALKVMPSSWALHAMNWRTLYCTPMAMTKSSACGCCNIIHCMRT